jgi:hypothetical protein
MTLDFIYDTPTAIVLIIFILVFLSLALIGLYIFTLFTADGFNKKFNDANTGTYLSIVATALALVIAFVITNEYQTYNTTSLNLAREANAIYSLIGILSEFNSVESAEGIKLSIQYLCSIINVEFPEMEQGILPVPNPCLELLQAIVLNLTPTNNKETVLYDKAIDQLNLAINLRNYRLEQTVASLPPEFYWLLIIGISILIVLTWFINGDLFYRVLMTSFITIIYSTLVTLVFILDLPFRGFFALGPEPYQLVLTQLEVKNCPSEECNITSIKEMKFLKKKVASCIKSYNNITLV